ncbi:DUF2459 domain-containing protein [Paraburkholderia ferrariae]|uniref:DUF2459 domain-containing protein n=1 Tax=Paraburkholderia ferrariae TaxID=386056 RepID=UPI0005AA7DD3|nr:DUF2459 domain-containing protein [Paraburkholderia ferrariae]
MHERSATAATLRSRYARRVIWFALLSLALGACAAADPPMPAAIDTGNARAAQTAIAVVQRDWHTDVCLRTRDADAWTLALARGFDGATTLCFGFGERQYVVERKHDPLTMLGALLPSRAAILMTVLRAAPEVAFGKENVIEAPVSDAGLSGLQRFLRDSIETDNANGPLRLADGPYPGSLYFAATGTYDALHTCNTWTARALRSAGLASVADTVFAGHLMGEARAAAAHAPDAP